MVSLGVGELVKDSLVEQVAHSIQAEVNQITGVELEVILDNQE